MISQQTSSYLQTCVSIFSYLGYFILSSYLVSVLRNAEYKYKSPTSLPRYLVSDTLDKNRHEDRSNRGLGIEHSDSGHRGRVFVCTTYFVCVIFGQQSKVKLKGILY